MAESVGDEPDEGGDRKRAAERCIDALRLLGIDRQIYELSTEIALAERNGDTERRDSLAQEHLELARKRSTLLPRAGVASTGI